MEKEAPFLPITLDELEENIVVVPGDGNRMFLCVGVVYDFQGPQDITIIAMADNLKTLFERVTEEGLASQKNVVMKGSVNIGQDSFKTEENGFDDIVVLNIVPDCVRGLRLSSYCEMLESIQAMEKKNAQKSGLAL
jgi:hypothetical protein